jgi:hypothetical protein
MAENYTRENYIIVNGAKYYTGTVFVINFNNKIQEAAFVCSVPKTNRILCKLADTRWWINTDDFRKRIIDITNKVDQSVHMPVTKTMKDSEIDGLFIGWLWYIFLMTISTLFYDRIGLWIFISVVFFNWRAKKIKEEGTYIEW